MRVNEGILFRRRRRSVLDYYLNRFFSSYQYSKMLRENALVVLRKYCLTLCRRALGVMSAKQKTRLILRRAFNIREYAYSLRRTFVQVRGGDTVGGRGTLAPGNIFELIFPYWRSKRGSAIGVRGLCWGVP